MADTHEYYVSCTWDNWPEGGSYGTKVRAGSYEEALELTRQEMAATRTEEDARDVYGYQWQEVDCFKLDAFFSLHAQGRSYTMTLDDWQDDRTNPVRVRIETKPDRIDLSLEDGRHVFLEWQDGVLRVHAYAPNREEPMNLEIHPDRVEIDDHDYLTGEL